MQKDFQDFISCLASRIHYWSHTLINYNRKCQLAFLIKSIYLVQCQVYQVHIHSVSIVLSCFILYLDFLIVYLCLSSLCTSSSSFSFAGKSNWYPLAVTWHFGSISSSRITTSPGFEIAGSEDTSNLRKPLRFLRAAKPPTVIFGQWEMSSSSKQSWKTWSLERNQSSTSGHPLKDRVRNDLCPSKFHRPWKLITVLLRSISSNGESLWFKKSQLNFSARNQSEWPQNLNPPFRLRIK